jgi:hypothetical protein
MVENLEKNVYVKEFPNPLNIYKKNENEYFEASITLKNLTNNYLIFKVYINKVDANQKAVYIPKPNTSFIKPFDSKKITVNRYNKSIVENNSNKDKFLIKIHAVDKVLNSDEEVKEMIKNKNYDEKKEQNIFINIKVNDSNPISNNDNDSMISEINNLNAEIFNLEISNKQLEEQLKNLEDKLKIIEQKHDVLTPKEKLISKTKNGINLKFVILFMMLSIVFGGYLSKIKNSFNKPKITN